MRDVYISKRSMELDKISAYVTGRSVWRKNKYKSALFSATEQLGMTEEGKVEHCFQVETTEAPFPQEDGIDTTSPAQQVSNSSMQTCLLIEQMREEALSFQGGRIRKLKINWEKLDV